MFKFFVVDPVTFWPWIRDPGGKKLGSGQNISDPQHWNQFLNVFFPNGGVMRCSGPHCPQRGSVRRRSQTSVKAFVTPLNKLFGTVLYRYIAPLACRIALLKAVFCSRSRSRTSWTRSRNYNLRLRILPILSKTWRNFKEIKSWLHQSTLVIFTAT